MKIYFIIALSILLAINKLNAQNEKGDLRLETTTNDSLKESIKIPELNVFLNSAIKNSPLLLASDREIDQILEKVKIEKNHGLILSLLMEMGVMVYSTSLHLVNKLPDRSILRVSN